VRRHELAATIAACVLLSYGERAAALSDDRIKLTAGESVTHDDNVFRLPSGTNPITALGTSDTSDTYHTTSLGLAFDVPTGAQRYRGELGFDRHQFGRFSALDLDGHRTAFDWLFNDEQRVSANVGHAESRRLASLSNIQSGTQSTVPNLIDFEQTYIHANFAVRPQWHLGAEISRSAQENSAPLYAVSDLEARMARLELAYVTPAETRVGIGTRRIAADLPNRQLIGARLVDNSYDQRQTEAFIEWQTSPHSRLDARAGWVERTHAELGNRDYDNRTWRISHSWQPIDLLTLTGLARHDISSTEEINVGFVLIESLEIQARWVPTERVDLTFAAGRGKREYRGDPMVALGLAPQTKERVIQTAVGAIVKVTRIVTLDCNWQLERRTSNIAAGNYRVGTTGVGVRVSF